MVFLQKIQTGLYKKSETVYVETYSYRMFISRIYEPFPENIHERHLSRERSVSPSPKNGTVNSRTIRLWYLAKLCPRIPSLGRLFDFYGRVYLLFTAGFVLSRPCSVLWLCGKGGQIHREEKGRGEIEGVSLHCNKRSWIFPSPSGTSLTRDGKIDNFFYSAPSQLERTPQLC
jgi:hypothetical protein